MSAVAEQITLHTEEYNITPTDSDLNSLSLELRQFSKMHNLQRLIQVYNSHVVCVTEKTGKRTTSFLLNLALLNDKPSRVRSIDPKFLVSALALGFLSYLTWLLKNKGIELLPNHYVYTVIALLISGVAISLILTVRSYSNTWVFETARGRTPVITLFHNHPDKKQFHRFVSEMINHIVMAKGNLRLSGSQLMPLEVGEHRRLCEKGIISKQQYERAKANILQGTR